jgi:hypothetical protein
MRGAVPRKFPFAGEVEQPRPDRAEPRLAPLNEPLPFRHPAGLSPSGLAVPRDEDRKVAAPLAISALDRPPVSAAARPMGSRFHLAIAGLLILAIGAVGGAAFLRFLGPAQEAVTAAPPAAAPSPQAGGTAGLVPPPAPTPYPAMAAAIPRPSLIPHAAGDNAAAKPPHVGPQATPVPPLDRAAASPMSVAGHATDRRPAIADADATRTAAAATDRAQDYRAARRSTANHRPAHPRTMARHAQSWPLREVKPGQPPSRSAQSSALRQAERPSRSAPPSATAPPDQAAAFDRLMEQLTEPTKPTDRALSPPAAGAPDPFAPRRADRSTPQ